MGLKNIVRFIMERVMVNLKRKQIKVIAKNRIQYD